MTFHDSQSYTKLVHNPQVSTAKDTLILQKTKGRRYTESQKFKKSWITLEYSMNKWDLGVGNQTLIQ